MKVFEFAKEVGVETIALMDKIRAWKLPVKSHMAALTDEQIEDIRVRLAEEAGGTAKKKTTKKVVKKKATTAKKKVAKKKTVVKKVTTAKATDAPTKKKTKKKTVIRRKAADIEAKAKEESLQLESAQSVGDEDTTMVAQNLAQENSNVEVATQEDISSSSESLRAQQEEVSQDRPRKGRNIVGKMDLSRVSGASSRPSPGTSSRPTASSGPVPGPLKTIARTGPSRNIRTGFVGPAPMIAEEDLLEKKAREEKKKKGAGAKDQPMQNFTASDFRKREVIFQPKKKRILTGQSKKTQITQPKAIKRIVKMQDTITVGDLAAEMSIKVPQLTKKLMSDGIMATMNTPLDYDTVSLIVGEFGFEVQNVALNDEDLLAKAAFGDLEAEPVIRPPVVTVMGHVDHGKTTLLDAIRNADVASGEAGGITQHIGAYNVTLENGSTTTFIDTPGHAAFTAMRSRGAHVTDIAIIVVAADDGMMPQTEEAISHAQAAGVPIIVAVNKIDKEGANPDRIKQQLAEKELVPEEWGGDTIFVPVSALKRQGIKELLENIHLVADVLELKANPKDQLPVLLLKAKWKRAKEMWQPFWSKMGQ